MPPPPRPVTPVPLSILPPPSTFLETKGTLRDFTTAASLLKLKEGDPVYVRMLNNHSDINGMDSNEEEVTFSAGEYYKGRFAKNGDPGVIFDDAPRNNIPWHYCISHIARVPGQSPSIAECARGYKTCRAFVQRLPLGTKVSFTAGPHHTDLLDRGIGVIEKVLDLGAGDKPGNWVNGIKGPNGAWLDTILTVEVIEACPVASQSAPTGPENLMFATTAIIGNTKADEKGQGAKQVVLQQAQTTWIGPRGQQEFATELKTAFIMSESGRKAIESNNIDLGSIRVQSVFANPTATH